jgi:hypothetical protein
VVLGQVELGSDARALTRAELRSGYDPLIADMAVQVLASWGLQQFDAVFIPWSIAAFQTLGGRLVGPLDVVCELLHTDANELRADVCVRDQAGRARFEFKALTLRKLDKG